MRKKRSNFPVCSKPKFEAAQKNAFKFALFAS